VYLHQTGLLARCFDELGAPETLMRRERTAPLDHFGGFLAIECPQSPAVARRLADNGVLTDARGHYLRLGPAPYLSDAQLEAAIERLEGAVSALSAA
jgi:kynureninase